MYVKVTNGVVDQYPYTIGNLRHDNPNTSFPKKLSDQTLNDWGLYKVEISQPPEVDERTQYSLQNDQPTLVDGIWVLESSIHEKTPEEIEEYDNTVAANNRNLRNDMLSGTDFYALSDNTMTEEMRNYREQLRDITSHPNWPNLNEEDWPNKP